MDPNRDRLMIHAELLWQRDTLALHIGRHVDREAVAVAQPLVFIEQPKNATSNIPAIELSRGDGQVLIDELWRAGLRPTEGAGSAGSMAATQEHLQDMRSIAFGALRTAGVITDSKP